MTQLLNTHEAGTTSAYVQSNIDIVTNGIRGSDLKQQRQLSSYERLPKNRVHCLMEWIYGEHNTMARDAVNRIENEATEWAKTSICGNLNHT
eukprot:3117293-Ditylum_brightwellii.AAC.1